MVKNFYQMSHSMQWKGLFLFRHRFQYWENLLLNMCECCNHMLRFEISPHWNCYRYLHIIIFLVRSAITALVHRLSQRSTSLALIIGLPLILGVGFRNIIDMRESILFRPYLTIMKKWVKGYELHSFDPFAMRPFDTHNYKYRK